MGEDEMIRSTVAVYAAQDDSSRLVDVPGDSRQCRVSSNKARNSTAGVIYWRIRLQLKNFSLNGLEAGPVGHLPPDAFCIDLNGMVKGSLALVDQLVPTTDHLNQRDMQRVANYARDYLYRTLQFPHLPPEVSKLFDLLDSFQPNQSILLKSHPALEDAIGQSKLFAMLYSLLLALKKREPTLFTNVMAAMEPDIASPDWVYSAIQNQVPSPAVKIFLQHFKCLGQQHRGLP